MTDQEKRFLLKKLRRAAALARLLNAKRAYPAKQPTVSEATARELANIKYDI